MFDLGSAGSIVGTTRSPKEIRVCNVELRTLCRMCVMTLSCRCKSKCGGRHTDTTCSGTGTTTLEYDGTRSV